MASDLTAWELEPKTLREYWSWIGASLYLLLSLDLLTTLYAASQYGVGAEANPYMRWIITQNVPMLIAINLVTLVVLVVFFAGYLFLLRRTTGTMGWVMAKSFELWLALLLAGGLFVFANNLSVIIHGASLL